MSKVESIFTLGVRFIVTVVIRGLETIFTIIVLGLSASLVNDYSDYGRGIYAVVVSVLTLLSILHSFFLPLSFEFSWYFLSTLLTQSLEFVLWLIVFSLYADDFGDLDCSLLADETPCHVGKAAVAFSFLNWLLLIVVLSLLVVFVVVPAGFAAFQSKVEWTPGGIFPVVAAKEEDPEKVVAAGEGKDEPAEIIVNEQPENTEQTEHVDIDDIISPASAEPETEKESEPVPAPANL
ncbi:predicted protein [Scheffersomyces stipitis CBS 6054]|uniref:MARVEL domain-containing protein n=1 Tax=Scheffersomyces stipitis (strain ATCC 58785 / CBS 6054 / NBRC 10063 / NRRL Y-11545) TaxID=322104 RepID=A3LNT8_PICST|nr:predicted protein [Scheffersomyces stipitis CBS 6054]ABN64386.2 predicted protein [Scheffersomyces stipitis CBS 6054]KAG2736637.1 hypothetical protein G9P44_000727 [Scheffersomyces stipitis]